MTLWFGTASALLAEGEAKAPLRIATWHPEMERKGPGLLLQDLYRGKDQALEAAIAVIAALDADILLLTAFDYDRRGLALGLLVERLSRAGVSYPYRFAPRPNTGWVSGFDLDGDGRLGGPGDAQGWGHFSGQGGMALLSKLPILHDEFIDHSGFLWRDLPGNLQPDTSSEAVREIWRLSSNGHWQVPIALEGGGQLTLLAYHATPPVFDGPEDRNGRRNHDETAFWLALIEGRLPGRAPPSAPFVVLGDGNLDPLDGEGRPEAMLALLSHPQLQDPQPKGQPRVIAPAPGAAALPEHRGDPALDTAFFTALGGLRLDLVLPSAELRVAAAGIWDGGADPALVSALAQASRHSPVWIEILLP